MTSATKFLNQFASDAHIRRRQRIFEIPENFAQPPAEQRWPGGADLGAIASVAASVGERVQRRVRSGISTLNAFTP